MNLFMTEVVTPPDHLPVTAADPDLAAAVVDEVERTVLWRALVRQERRIVIDGPLPSRIEIEPVTAITSLTKWTPTDDAVVVDAASYYSVTRDPGGTILEPVPWENWPAPERSIGSFTLTYTAGWVVTPESAPGAGDGVNRVPSSVRLMISRAIAFRAGSGLGDISIGSLKLSVLDSYASDQLPKEIASIGRAYAYRPGLFSARP